MLCSLYKTLSRYHNHIMFFFLFLCAFLYNTHSVNANAEPGEIMTPITQCIIVEFLNEIINSMKKEIIDNIKN